jgi:transcriptional regulator with XRE-family HTH domain
MARTAQPTANRVLLGHEIAHVRTELGMKQAELGKAIGKGQDTIHLLEQGRATVTAEQLHRLIEKLEITAPENVAAILDMHKDSNKRGEWTTGYNRVYAENLRLLIDLERHADQIFSAMFEILPGLLQCPSYVRALSSRNRLPRGVSADQIAAAWKSRQEILERPDGPVVHFVLSESCLRRRWGPAEVMHEQMQHLIAMSHKPNVRIQVLTFDDSEEDLSPVGHGFTLLRVPNRGQAGDLHMAYNEGVNEIYYRDDPKALDAHEEAKAAMVAAARNPEDSRQFIDYVANTFLPGVPTLSPPRRS